MLLKLNDFTNILQSELKIKSLTIDLRIKLQDQK